MMLNNLSSAIINIHNNNNSSSLSNSLSLSLSGKSLYHSSNPNNIYDSGGIGIQLLSNINNYREIAFVDSSNISNPNHPSLSIAITPSSTHIRNRNSNNLYKPILLNNSISITSNSLGIGTNNPSHNLHIHSIDTQPSSIQFTNIFDNNPLTTISGFTISRNQVVSSFINNNGHLIINPHSCNIGIGTTNPI